MVRSYVVGLVLCLAAVLGLAPGVAVADHDPVALALQGDDTVEYAIAWSQVAYPPETVDAGNGPERALLGRDDGFADSLASGALQSGSPLLLTPPAVLAEQTQEELARLGVQAVTVLGGEAAVSSGVVAELEALGYEVERLSGPTRIDTAVAIARSNAGKTAILARASGDGDPTRGFADSLAAGGWAADEGYDVLLTDSTSLSPSTRDQIAAAGYERVMIVGGTAAVSAEVEQAVRELVGQVDRVSGPTRFHTAVAVAEARGFSDTSAADVTILVNGESPDGWADGFAAAHLAARGYPILLSSAGDELPAPTREFAAADGMSMQSNMPVAESEAICGSTLSRSLQLQQSCSQFAAVEIVLTPLIGQYAAAVTPLAVNPGSKISVVVGGLSGEERVHIFECGVWHDEKADYTDRYIGYHHQLTLVLTIPETQPTGDCPLSVYIDRARIVFSITVHARDGLVYITESRIWRTAPDDPARVSVAHVTGLTGVDTVPGTPSIVTTTQGDEAAVHVRNAYTGQVERVYRDASIDAFRFPTVSPDGTKLAVVAEGDSESILVFDLSPSGFRVPQILASGKDLVLTDGSWSPASTRLAWSALVGDRVDSFVRDAARTAAATKIADGTDRVTWRSDDEITVRSDLEHEGDALATFSPEGDFVSIQAETGGVSFGTPLSTPGSSLLTVTRPTTSTDPDHAGLHDVLLFDAPTSSSASEPVDTITAAADDFMTGVPWEVGGTRVAFLGPDRTIEVYDTEGGEFTHATTLEAEKDIIDLRWF